jgi:hypothetical protein
LPSAFFRRKPPVIPESGQRVRLRSGRARWRGNFRAISLPYTDEGIGMVIRTCPDTSSKVARAGRSLVQEAKGKFSEA